MNTIGTRIAKKRKTLGLTQDTLAAQLGISSQAVSKWENDISAPDIGLLPALAKALNCTTDELLTGKTSEVHVVPESQRKDPNTLMLRIRALSADGDKVRVNLPFSLLKAFSETGMDIAAQFSGIESLKGINLEHILTLMENGTVGKLVEMENADGSAVEIVVE